MGPLIDAGTRDALRALSVGNMTSGYVRLVYDGSATDTYGNPAPTWTAESATRDCMYRPATAEEQLATAQVPALDAHLWVQLSDAIADADRVRLTVHYGQTLATPLTFEVVGVKREATTLHLELRKVTDGS